MSLWDKVSSWGEKALEYVGKMLESTNNNNSHQVAGPITTYEPDKIRVAEIEKQTQLQLADKEAERIVLMTRAKLEILREEGNFQLAIEQARVNGLEKAVKIIEQMRDRVTEIAQLRVEIIGSASLSVIKETEEFYAMLEDKMRQDDEHFDNTRLPALLDKLEHLEVGSAAHTLFEKRIGGLIENQLASQTEQLLALRNRQMQVITGLQQTTLSISEHANAMEDKLLKAMLSGAEVTGNAHVQSRKDVHSLTESDPLLLGK